MKVWCLEVCSEQNWTVT